jgi:hypothetical protein
LFGPAKSGEATFALDTGATTTLVDPRLLVLIGLDPANPDDHVFITAATSVTYVPKIVVNAIECLGQRRERLAVIAASLPPSAGLDGLLGLDFFRDRVLTLNFRNGLITLA